MRNYNLRKRIVVTGGGGFLGSHLIGRLLERGDEVVCADNFFTGARRNIEEYLDHPRFELTRYDVTFPLYVEVDQIYKLAGPASPVHYQHDPVQTTTTSVHGAINMLAGAPGFPGPINLGGWTPEVQLEEGLGKTIAYFDAPLSAGVRRGR